MSMKTDELKWAGEVSALGFIVEGLIASLMVGQGSAAARSFGEDVLRQWEANAMTVPEGMSPFDAALIHQAGASRIKALFGAVTDRIEQVENG